MCRRALAVRISAFAFLVGAPTVLLLYLGLTSIRGRQEAHRRLNEANRLLEGELLIADLESRALLHAEACFNEAAYDRLGDGCLVGRVRVGEYLLLAGGVPSHPRSPSGFLRRVAADLRVMPSRAPGLISPVGYTDPPAQVFAIQVDRHRPQRTLALVLDLDQFAANDFAISGRRFAQRARPLSRGDPAYASGMRFRRLFPFWRIGWREDGSPAAGEGGLFLAAALSASAGAALAIGIAALVWEGWRQARTARLLATFTGAVAHDLRTPLAVVRFYADLMRDGTDEEKRSIAETMAAKADELTRRVHGLLRGLRAQRLGREYFLAPGCLGSLVSETLEENRRRFAFEGAVIDSSRIEPVPIVSFDREAVSDAVLNLLENAVKYSPRGSRVEVAVFAAAGAAVIEVCDGGIGIPPAEHERIFEEYYRAPGDVKGGFGIGLYNVRQIMQAHGGRVEVASTPGRGSRFRLLFRTHEQSIDSRR